MDRITFGCHPSVLSESSDPGCNSVPGISFVDESHRGVVITALQGDAMKHVICGENSTRRQDSTRGVDSLCGRCVHSCRSTSLSHSVQQQVSQMSQVVLPHVPRTLARSPSASWFHFLCWGFGLQRALDQIASNFVEDRSSCTAKHDDVASVRHLSN